MQDQELKALILGTFDERRPIWLYLFVRHMVDACDVESCQVREAVLDLVDAGMLTHSSGMLRAGPRLRAEQRLSALTEHHMSTPSHANDPEGLAPGMTIERFVTSPTHGEMPEHMKAFMPKAKGAT